MARHKCGYQFWPLTLEDQTIRQHWIRKKSHSKNGRLDLSLRNRYNSKFGCKKCANYPSNQNYFTDSLIAIIHAWAIIRTRKTILEFSIPPSELRLSPTAHQSHIQIQFLVEVGQHRWLRKSQPYRAYKKWKKDTSGALQRSEFKPGPNGACDKSDSVLKPLLSDLVLYSSENQPKCS